MNKSSDFITETFSAIWFTLDADLATDKITSSRFWLSWYNKTILSPSISSRYNSNKEYPSNWKYIFFSLENNPRSTFPFKSLIVDLSPLSLNTATSDKTSFVSLSFTVIVVQKKH